MLSSEIKQKIDNARDILVGKIPTPTGQVEQITLSLIYKFMSDIDDQNAEMGSKTRFFNGDYQKYAWKFLLDKSLSAYERVTLYGEGLEKMSINPNLPQFFRDVFRGAFLPFRDPDVLTIFLKQIDEFHYGHNGDLGDAFEYLLQVMGAQGDAGQFLTPRHIINFIVSVVNPQKTDRILDPACGTAGFLISAYKHILAQNTKEGTNKAGSALTFDERRKLAENFVGYDISHDMVRLSLVNLYLHEFPNPKILEYDTLTSLDRWDDDFECILANPPFMTPKGGIRPHKRFSIQANRSEVLFVDYMMEHLTPSGKAGIIVPEGIIFQSANAYKSLRKMMIDQNFLYAVVSLPAGVFQPYSGVKTSILLMDKGLAKRSKDILFVKVQADGFDLGAQRRVIDKNDLPTASEILKRYKTSIQTGEHFILSEDENQIASLVPIEKISNSGDYNLSGDRYKEAVVLGNQKWPMVELGAICTLINGRAFKPTDWEKSEKGGLPIIRIQNLNNGDAEYNYYSGTVEEKLLVNKGDLLFSWSGSRGTSFGPHIWKSDTGILNQHIFRVLHSDSINKQFFYFMLKKAVHEVEENLHGGVGLVHITKGNLERIKIPLPPLEVQKEIVTQLDSYQKIIDGAKQVVDNYKPEIKIDPSWEMVELEKIFPDIKNGRNVEQLENKGKYRVSRIQSISDGSFNIEKTKWTNDSVPEEYFLKNGDILLSHINSMDHLAKSALFNGIDEKIVHGINLLRLRPNFNLINPKYAEVTLKSVWFIQQARSFAQKAVNQASIKTADIRAIKIPLPPLDIQKQIVARIEKEQQSVDAIKKLIRIYEDKIKEKIDEVWGSIGTN